MLKKLFIEWKKDMIWSARPESEERSIRLELFYISYIQKIRLENVEEFRMQINIMMARIVMLY